MNKLQTLLTVGLVTLSLGASAKDTYPDITEFTIDHAYDGDTLFINIPSFPDIAGKNIGIRVLGIDTPEMHGKCQQEKDLAKKAKYRMIELLENAENITLTNVGRDKYFRIDANVMVDGVDAGKILVEEGLAVEYFGGTKVKDWCE